MGTKPYLFHLPMGYYVAETLENTVEAIKGQTSLSYGQDPVHFCDCILDSLNFATRCSDISCLTERWQSWSSCMVQLQVCWAVPWQIAPTGSIGRAHQRGNSRAEGQRVSPHEDGTHTTYPAPTTTLALKALLNPKPVSPQRVGRPGKTCLPKPHTSDNHGELRVGVEEPRV